MTKRVGQKIKMTSIDELLCVPSVAGCDEIEVAKIRPFKDHPFKVLDDEKILGFVMMVTSVFCVITKIMDVPVFVEMFLAGAAFEAIPILLIKLGEEGMLGLMDLLGRV